MATGATTGTKLIIAGDFRTAYTIVDRLGITAELIPISSGRLWGISQLVRGVYTCTVARVPAW